MPRGLAWHHQVLYWQCVHNPEKKKYKYQLFLDTENNCGLPQWNSGFTSAQQHTWEGFVPQMNFQHQTCNTSSGPLLSSSPTLLTVFYSLNLLEKYWVTGISLFYTVWASFAMRTLPKHNRGISPSKYILP